MLTIPCTANLPKCKVHSLNSLNLCTCSSLSFAKPCISDHWIFVLPSRCWEWIRVLAAPDVGFIWGNLQLRSSPTHIDASQALSSAQFIEGAGCCPAPLSGCESTQAWVLIHLSRVYTRMSHCWALHTWISYIILEEEKVANLIGFIFSGSVFIKC